MISYKIPYGDGHLSFRPPNRFKPELIKLRDMPGVPEPQELVLDAISNPVGGVSLFDLRSSRSVAIAINDKTRPALNHQLLPPLLRHLEKLGIKPGAIQFLIATGTHPRMSPAEYQQMIPLEILERFPVHCHHCDDRESLEAGTIGINDGVPSTSNCPFGGFKESGWGRELGIEGMDAFLETKHVSFGGMG